MLLSQIQLPDVGALVQFGVAGITLGWFMFRMERRLENHTETIGALTKAILIDVLSREFTSDPVRKQAQALMDTVTARREGHKN